MNIDYGKAICTRCCLPIDGPPHHSRDLNDGLSFECEYADDEAAARLDDRFDGGTNAALSALNHFVIDVAPRLSVGQHSQLMRRLENVLVDALTRAPSQHKGGAQ